MSEQTPSEAAVAAATDPEAQATMQAQQAAEKANQEAWAAAQANPSGTPLSDDEVRAKGGYFLMDDTWVAGGPWDGMPAEEMQSEEGRRADIEKRIESGTAFAWTEDGTPNGALAGYFEPDEQGRAILASHVSDRRAFAIEHGNGIVGGTIDPTYTVPGV